MHFANFARPWTRRVPDWARTWNVHNFIPRSFETSQQQKLGSWSGTFENRYWKQEQSSNISKCFGSFGKKRVHWLLLFCFQMLWKVATVNSLNSNTLTKPFCLLTQGCLWDRCGLRLLQPLVIVQLGSETNRKLGILRTRRGKKNLGSLICRKTTWWFMIFEYIRTISASKNKGNTWK